MDKTGIKLLVIILIIETLWWVIIYSNISNIYNNQINNCSVSVEDDKKYTWTWSLQYIFEEWN